MTGDRQSGAVEEKLSHALVVSVTDEFGNPVRNAEVTFAVTSGGGRLEGGTVLTDAIGLASSGAWTLGPEPGVQEVTARSAGVASLFSAFACVDCPVLLFVRNGLIYRTSGDGPAVLPLTEGVQPAWSPDGRQTAFVREGPGAWGEIYIMDSDGSRIIRRTREPVRGDFVGGLHAPTWSADGSKLAVASGNNLYEGDIVVLSAADDGEAPDTVAVSGGWPAWSPDGSQIAFVSLSGDDGYQALHVVNADGTGLREVTQRDEGGITRPTWSPDGAKIAFSKCVRGSCDIYSVGADGSGLTQLTRGRIAYSPSWSPDGAWIAFTVWSDWTDPRRTASIGAPRIADVIGATTGSRRQRHHAPPTAFVIRSIIERPSPRHG